jgi:alpha-1,2-mannosyltransferase
MLHSNGGDRLRPEKEHVTQLRAFAELIKHPDFSEKAKKVRLVLIGGSRNADDAARVDRLKEMAVNLGIQVIHINRIVDDDCSRALIQDQTEFLVNAPYPTILEWLSRASVGLNTMVDEHFGINVVEYMVKLYAI